MKTKKEDKPKYDISIINASPITCTDIDVTSRLYVDELNLSVGKLCIREKVNATGKFKIKVRPLVYTYDNGKTKDVGALTHTTFYGKNSSSPIVSCMISYKDSLVTNQLKEYLKDKDLVKIWNTLVDYKKIKSFHTGEERLLAIVIAGGKKKYVLTDRRQDLDSMVNINKSISYKIVSEKFGYNFSDKTRGIFKKRYPHSKMKSIEMIASDRMIDARTAYIEIAKLLINKSKTPNRVKVDAKRLLSRVRGDRIWMKI